MQIYLEDYMSELTNIENGKVKLSLKIPAEDYRRALESAYRRTCGDFEAELDFAVFNVCEF